MKRFLLLVLLSAVILCAADAGSSMRDILEFDLPDTPLQEDYPNNPNPYGNSWEDLGWTSINVEQTGTIDFIHLTGNLFSDNYSTEGSLRLMSPASTIALIDDSFVIGTNAVDYTITAFDGESITGEWILYFVDDYNDGGHALYDGVFRIITNYPVHNITQDTWYYVIQEGIDAAANGDVIIVAPGTYNENINFMGKAITVGSFYHTTADTVYIGSTIIDGGLNDSVIKFENGETTDSRLTGFTITNGERYTGGGIYCDTASPTLDNLRVINNSGLNHGGGIFCTSSSAVVHDIVISGNTSNYGGGLASLSSQITYENMIISNNSAEYGGGVFLSGGDPVFSQITISENDSETGGAIFAEFTDFIVNDAMVNNNNGGINGSTIKVVIMSSITMSNSVIDNNSAVGLFVEMDSYAYLDNVVITRNGNDYHGGICGQFSYLSLKNVTIADNQAAKGLYFNLCDIELINSIVWNNGIEIDYNSYNNSFVIAYCDILGGIDEIETDDIEDVYWLEGNIDVNPVFIDPAANDYHLDYNSPCIDAGTAYLEYEGDVLIDMDEGDYEGSAPDMGAYEADSIVVYGDVDDSGEVDSYDVSLIMMVLVGIDPLEEDPLPWQNWRVLRADVDLDEMLSSMDCSYILQYIVELREELPVN